MGKKRVLLIYPPLTTANKVVTPPIKAILIGLAYLGAVVRAKGHTVAIIDGILSTPQNIKLTMLAFKPDVVGISAMFTPYATDAHAMASLAKQTLPNCKVIFGGAHATTFPEDVIKDPNVDVIIVGEGEITICEVLDNLYNLSGVKGIVHRLNNQVVYEPPRELIEDLDTLPFPAWDLLQHDLEVIKDQTKNNKFIMRKPAIHLLTSRGCPKGCYFCSVKLMWGRKWRARSAQNVVKEIEWLKSMGYREFYFMDDNATVSKTRIYEICNAIIKKGWNIRLATPTGIALDSLDKHILAKMKKAGFYRLCFGIETGNQDSQLVIKKLVDLDKAKALIKTANKLGFWTSGTFILGFPHESLAEIGDTFRFIKASGMDFPVIHLLNPQPKTEVYNIMVNEGLITPDIDLNLTYANGFKTKYFNNKDLHFIVAQLYKKFIIHKIFSFTTYINLLRKIRSIEDIKYMLCLVSIPLNMLKRSLKGQKLSVIAIRQDQELEDL
jgi:anaerobic magnesium-protoporphyrin IX monomethyl ester cyclase